MSVDARTREIQSAPIDEQAAAKLAANGYELRVVDSADREAVDRYLQAEARGFFGPVMTRESLDAHAAEFTTNRRLTAVYDPEGADPLTPIATSNSWIGPLTIPGGEIPAWAISGVTTAQTHRRRGIQRQIIEAELRTAHRLGVAIAMLTVSESSIYGRYGFGVAALAAEYRIRTRGLAWTGPVPAGRLDYIPVRRWRDQAPALFEQLRLRAAGQVAPFGMRWDQVAGFQSRKGDTSDERRAVQYRDESGELRGMAIYTVSEDPDDFTAHRVAVLNVIAASDDAYAAIWRFFVEMDLVATVTYDLGAVDEPMRWMVSDFRAVEVKPFDMHYLRVLDAATVLGSRSYETDGEAAFRVIDDLGIASGSYALTVSGGRGAVSDAAEPADPIEVAELGAAIVGAPSRKDDALGRLLETRRAPAIGFWY
ncbi:GNAT family N-acetyltransferase [Pseudolysinimonas sp.]|uniref:GNAT family N-acetyltransferase n=1 Tax=Pseudolysinimonas sp. TaxID=2680009 RepID=UPI003F7DC85B